MSLKLKAVADNHNTSDIINQVEKQLNSIKEDEKINVVLFSDIKPNPALPQLKYLNGVVLKTISDGLPDHPPVAALYGYFEEMFAPILEHTIAGETYQYFDLKKSKVADMNAVIAKIIEFAKTTWGIDVLTKIESRQPQAFEAYADAYANQWEGLEEVLKNK